MFQDRTTIFPQFIKKLFHEHDIANLDPGINKTGINILMLTNRGKGANNTHELTDKNVLTGRDTGVKSIRRM